LVNTTREIRVDRLDFRTVAAWRKRLPEGSAWHAHKALRQVLAYAVRAKLVAENVAQQVPNPEPKRREVEVFASWDEVEKIADELGAERRLLPILCVGTGLRPEEWLALERRDVDIKGQVMHVRRVYVDGRLREYGKQSKSIRRIPLRARVLEAIGEHPWRLDSRLVFPGDRGEHIDLQAWRRGDWYTALEAAGLAKWVPYAMRHTFASFAIAAGISLFYLARLMGSSVEQIDRTYGHMLPDSEDYMRGLLDAYDTLTDRGTLSGSASG
jgi:integrase